MKTLVAFLSAAVLGLSLQAAEPIPAEYKTGGFAIGAQAYSFNRFSLMEAIEKNAQAGGKVIELYPGQRLSKEQPDVKFDHNASPEVLEKVNAKLKEHKTMAVAYGVVGIPNDEQKARPIFEFAKKMGIRVINTESTNAIDVVEKLVKEFDIKVGYHNHPSRPNDANYKVWDPKYIAELVKDRDERIGACADTGHWIRSGIKPVEALEILKGRVVSSHLKDLHEFSRKGHDVPYGKGVAEMKQVLEAFAAMNFDGPISVEYEHNWDNNVDEIRQCIDFVRSHGEKK